MNKKYSAWSKAIVLSGAAVLGGAVFVLGCGGDDSTSCSPVQGDAAVEIPHIDAAKDTGVVTSSALGKACATDTDCGSPFSCLTSVNSGTNSVAHGVCSINCNSVVINQNAANVCDPYNGVCVDFSLQTDPTPDAWCMESCAIGAPVGGGGVGVPAKCHARDDAACFPSQSQPDFGYCHPLCTSDDDCATGKKCDPFGGLCVTTVAAGAPLGSACTQDANGNSTQCPICLPVGDSTSMATFCSAFCRLGTPGACAFGPALDGGGSAGACLFSSGNSSAGDLGFCAELCDVDADCRDQADHLVCDKSTVDAMGRGVCNVGQTLDAGTDAGTQPDASSDAGDAAPASDAGDAGTTDSAPGTDAAADGGAG